MGFSSDRGGRITILTKVLQELCSICSCRKISSTFITTTKNVDILSVSCSDASQIELTTSNPSKVDNRFCHCRITTTCCNCGVVLIKSDLVISRCEVGNNITV